MAARVQAHAGAGEIALTDDALFVPGAAGLVTSLSIETSAVELRGVPGGPPKAS